MMKKTTHAIRQECEIWTGRGGKKYKRSLWENGTLNIKTTRARQVINATPYTSRFLARFCQHQDALKKAVEIKFDLILKRIYERKSLHIKHEAGRLDYFVEYPKGLKTELIFVNFQTKDGTLYQQSFSIYNGEAEKATNCAIIENCKKPRIQSEIEFCGQKFTA